jgi:hypothetical protein
MTQVQIPQGSVLLERAHTLSSLYTEYMPVLENMPDKLCFESAAMRNCTDFHDVIVFLLAYIYN